MKYRKIGLLIMASVFCLAITQIAGANAVMKTLYVDGAKVGNGAAGPQDLSYLFSRLTIGAEGSQYYRYNGFKGQIDDIAVYPSVLSAAQIASHYSAANRAAFDGLVSTDGARLYLKLGEASKVNGAAAANTGSSGASLNGIYIGAITSSADRFAAANGAATLAGATGGTGDCIDVGDTASLISTSEVTVEMWVKLDNTITGYPRLFQHNNGENNKGSYGGLYVVDSCGVGLIGGNNTGYVTKNLKDGAWHQVVITYSPIIVSATRSYPDEVKSDNPCVYMRFEGETQMEEIENSWRYYYKYKTTVYDWNIPTLLAYGDPGEQTRTECKQAGSVGDSIFMNSTYVHHSGPPSGWGSDGHSCIANAMGSDGTLKPRYEQMRDDPNFGFAKGDISYEIWVKRSAPGEPARAWPNRRLMSAEESTPYREPEPNNVDPNLYAFYSTILTQGEIAGPNNPGANAAAGPQLDFAEGDANHVWEAQGNIRVRCGVRVAGQNDWYTGVSIPGNDTDWHQLVLVYDQTGIGDPCRYGPGNGDDTNTMDVYLYKDGVLAASLHVVDPNRDQPGYGAGKAKLGPWSCTMLIGSSGSWGFGLNPFSGYMDEFAIYQRVLPADRILAHYAAWQPRNCLDAQNRGLGMEADLDKDCDVDFSDFALLALKWASCNAPGVLGCNQTW